MKWFTCTPVEFGGGADFFARDSGLLCRGMQAIGVESRAVMPGKRKPEDEADLLRTDYRNLESADWWAGHGLDGVVLYAWGRPKFLRVARAIHEAGIFLVLNQDNGGLVSPRLGLRDWLEEQRVMSGAGRVLGGWWRFLKLAGKGLTVGWLAGDRLRARHLGYGDVIACVSPVAAAHHRRFCRIFGGEDMAARVAVEPHAVSPVFGWDGSVGKRRQVVVVGRWDDEVQKRPGLMMGVLGALVSGDPVVEVEVVGTVTVAMRGWHEGLPDEARQRVRMRGRVLPVEIAGLMAASQVSYCPSAFESFHIASAEALCCGCSVVATESVSMASFGWFVSERSGRLAASDDAGGHLEALRGELEMWASGQRDAGGIAAVWGERLRADRVAAMVVGRNK